MHAECKHHVNIADGASNVFYAYLGWIPAVAYVGLWEAIWRIWYRKRISKMGKDYKGKRFSTVLIISSIPIWAYGILLISMIIFMLTVCPEGRVSADQCWF